MRPGDHVLEIGSGWGGLAIHAARERDVRVTTATISPAQFDLATRRVAEAGLAGRVEVVLEDYRDLRGAHDRIVSVEMFEAVGERYWPAFFATCDRLLRPGGAMAMQTITMPHRRFRDSRRPHTWMHRYIFPGGLIPSEQAIGEAMARASRLRTTAAVQIGHHYAETLRHWRARFLARRAEVRALGFDEPFVRMWEFYLAYCQAGFATGTIGDVQLRLERPVRLAGAAVWVTGASSGIGAALAAELAGRGPGWRPPPAGPTSWRRSPRAGTLVVPADVADGDAMRGAAERVEAELGRIDLAVFNAGVWSPVDVRLGSRAVPQPLRHQSDGLVHGRRGLPGMRRRRRGRDRRDGQRGRLPRLPQLRGVRCDQGRRDRARSRCGSICCRSASRC